MHALNWTCEGQGLWVGNKQRRREECHLQRLRAKAGVGLSPAAPFLRPFPASSCWSLPLSITLVTPTSQLPSFWLLKPTLSGSPCQLPGHCWQMPCPGGPEDVRALLPLRSSHSINTPQMNSSIPTASSSAQPQLPSPGQALSSRTVGAQGGQRSWAGTTQVCQEKSMGQEH